MILDKKLLDELKNWHDNDPRPIEDFLKERGLGYDFQPSNGQRHIIGKPDQIGWLYIMLLPRVSEDIIKIGYTTGDPLKRAKQLGGLSLIQAWLVMNPRRWEQLFFRSIADRVRRFGAEYFDLNRYEAIALVSAFLVEHKVWDGKVTSLSVLWLYEASDHWRTSKRDRGYWERWEDLPEGRREVWRETVRRLVASGER